MIIGNGLLAKAFMRHFSGDPGVVVFASGVSNSSEADPGAFERERQLLQTALVLRRRLVYFSTCSIYDDQLSGTPYVRHKLEMERMTSESGCQHHVFRLPQVVGKSSNPHTLTNFLHHQIATGGHFKVWQDACRNLIDIDDVEAMARHVIEQAGSASTFMNIACPFSVRVSDLVGLFESVLKKRARCEIVPGGSRYSIDTAAMLETAREIGIAFDADYPLNLIGKYYAG